MEIPSFSSSLDPKSKFRQPGMSPSNEDHHLPSTFPMYLPCAYLLQIFFFFNKFIYLFIFGCVGSSFLCEAFLQFRRAGATLHRGARASHCRGLSRCGAQAPDAQAQ